MNSDRQTMTQINALMRGFDVLKAATHVRVEIQTLQALLIVARSHESSASLIGNELGITSGAASRILARLSDVATRSGRGYGYLQSKEDWQDRRNKIVTLTPKGKQVVTNITNAMANTKEY